MKNPLDCASLSVFFAARVASRLIIESHHVFPIDSERGTCEVDLCWMYVRLKLAFFFVNHSLAIRAFMVLFL